MSDADADDEFSSQTVSSLNGNDDEYVKPQTKIHKECETLFKPRRGRPAKRLPVSRSLPVTSLTQDFMESNPNVENASDIDNIQQVASKENVALPETLLPVEEGPIAFEAEELK